MAQLTSGQHRGWRWDEANTRLDVVINGTEVGYFDDATADLTLNTNGLSVDSTTESSSAVTGSIHTDGGVGITKNLFIGSTLENSDGVGTDGEQLTSGGAAAATDWAAAACLREFKNVMDERTDADAVLAALVETPVYDFKYKRREESEGHIMSTGDVETTYTGIMADDAPWATHHKGRILNPINTFGHTVLALKALDQRMRALEIA